MSANYLEHFSASMLQNLQEMAGLEAEASQPAAQETAFASQGFSVIIGITGKRPGRIILDTTQETACKLSNTINGEECDEEFVLDTMAELTNIVSGNGITTVVKAIFSKAYCITASRCNCYTATVHNSSITCSILSGYCFKTFQVFRHTNLKVASTIGYDT